MPKTFRFTRQIRSLEHPCLDQSGLKHTLEVSPHSLPTQRSAEEYLDPRLMSPTNQEQNHHKRSLMRYVARQRLICKMTLWYERCQSQIKSDGLFLKALKILVILCSLFLQSIVFRLFFFFVTTDSLKAGVCGVQKNS